MLLGGAVAMRIGNAQGANSTIEPVEDAVAIRANPELVEPRREHSRFWIIYSAPNSRPPAISR